MVDAETRREANKSTYPGGKWPIVVLWRQPGGYEFHEHGGGYVYRLTLLSD